MASLEDRIDTQQLTEVHNLPDAQDLYSQATRKNIGQRVFEYCLDPASAMAFYLPLYRAIEAGFGMEADEIMVTRSLATLFYFGVMKAYGDIRARIAPKLNITQQTKKWKRKLFERTYMLSWQIPFYAGSLAVSGANLEEALPSFITGLTTSVLTADYFGKWMDWQRKGWGVKAGVHKQDDTTEHCPY